MELRVALFRCEESSFYLFLRCLNHPKSKADGFSETMENRSGYGALSVQIMSRLGVNFVFGADKKNVFLEKKC